MLKGFLQEFRTVQVAPLTQVVAPVLRKWGVRPCSAASRENIPSNSSALIVEAGLRIDTTNQGYENRKDEQLGGHVDRWADRSLEKP